MPSNAVSVNHCRSHQQMFSQLLLLAAPLPHFWLISSLLLANIGHATANSAAASGSSVAEEQHFSRHHHRSSSNSHELAAMAAQGYGYQQSGSRLSAGSGGGQRLNRCYSCMSPLYEQLFKDGDFGSFFFEPRNFTAQCEGPNMDTRGIGLVPCRGICLSLAQEFIIMGRKTGKRLWMRGCAHSLSRHGYQNRTIAYFAEFDLCRQLLASELFRLTSGDHSAEFADGFMGQSGPMDSQQSIMVCSCLGDRCNSQSSSGHRSSHSFPGIGLSLLLLFLALLSPCFTAEYPPYATFNIHFVYFFATK